jgi:DNA-binding NtrC family response regulator
VIAATNQDLAALVQKGDFREDFYYRINVFQIEIPPLRERRSDILPCAEHFLRHFARHNAKKVSRISQEAADMLINHSWRGNIRELKNAIERAVVVSGGPELLLEDLPMHVIEHTPQASGESLEDVDRAHIAHVLDREEWNITRSARILGIDRATLYSRIKKYGLTK